jgi:hypothetical protein
VPSVRPDWLGGGPSQDSVSGNEKIEQEVDDNTKTRDDRYRLICRLIHVTQNPAPTSLSLSLSLSHIFSLEIRSHEPYTVAVQQVENLF